MKFANTVKRALSSYQFVIAKNSKKGFTLVELMVVVAIMGILASIGVPQFQKFQAKARQGEAKSLLGGLYGAQKAYSAESQSFSSCLNGIGFVPEGANRNYAIGFTAAGSNCGPDGAQGCDSLFSGGANISCIAASGQGSVFFYTATAKAGLAGKQTAVGASGTTIAQNSFTAGASGSISNSTTVTDAWTINEAKVLKNATTGL